MRTCCVVGLLLAMAIGSGASASPLLRGQNLAEAATADVVVIHHKPGHKMKHANRGHHYGWTRGKHKGWHKFR